jgi:hypothetical protein
MDTRIDLGSLLIESSVLDSAFVCDLQKCRGVCCKAGSAGAPISLSEIDQLEESWEDVVPYMNPNGIEAIGENGVFYVDVDNETVTTLQKDGACAFSNTDDDGILFCSIEKAYMDGILPFNKPLSCHLFPIRMHHTGDKPLLVYEKIDTCAPACTLGNKLQTPLYQFTRKALVRAFGDDTFNLIEEAAELWKNQSL